MCSNLSHVVLGTRVDYSCMWRSSNLVKSLRYSFHVVGCRVLLDVVYNLLDVVCCWTLCVVGNHVEHDEMFIFSSTSTRVESLGPFP